MSRENLVSIAPLLKILTGGDFHSDSQIALKISTAISYLFDNKLSAEQCASLLTALRLTGLDEEPSVIAACAQAMRQAASSIDEVTLRKILSSRIQPQGTYHGGLCDIVGTGGDGHSTFNVSTTSSIIASAFLAVAKHGAQASSSKSGSADVLMAVKPNGPDIEAVTAETIIKVLDQGNYAFLFAKQFHPAMRFAAPVRKEIGFRTIFNILGPLANPLHNLMEAGVYGVYKRSLGPVYAKALQLCGTKNAMVVCGAEDLDEISCAGLTYCWRITEKASVNLPESGESHETAQATGSKVLTEITTFTLQPSDFGLPSHRLDEVLPGQGPMENADLLMRMLRNQLPVNHPTMEFVLMNAAALLVIAGVCNETASKMGPGDNGKVIDEIGPGGGRWKEGVRRARWAIENGSAARSLDTFIKISRSL